MQKREREGDRQTRIRSVRCLPPFKKKAAFEVFINITCEAHSRPTEKEHVGNVQKRLSTCLFRQRPARAGQGKSGGERTGILGADFIEKKAPLMMMARRGCSLEKCTGSRGTLNTAPLFAWPRKSNNL
ncbi:hypothetical protein QQF64_011902 [Cirrhinus molitorella]|uniref:Uncharacterized protein n=1 Tax=Cirrhinus molitorella TaxID=172907 RepID=A0ABR3LTY4_9TELE